MLLRFQIRSNSFKERLKIWKTMKFPLINSYRIIVNTKSQKVITVNKRVKWQIISREFNRKIGLRVAWVELGLFEIKTLGKIKKVLEEDLYKGLELRIRDLLHRSSTVVKYQRQTMNTKMKDQLVWVQNREEVIMKINSFLLLTM